MENLIELLAKYHGVEPGDIINARIEGYEAVCIVNRGIKGSPKYRVPVAELEALDAEAQEQEAEDPEPAELDATDGAIALILENDLDATQFLGRGRITARDVKAVLEVQE